MDNIIVVVDTHLSIYIFCFFLFSFISLGSCSDAYCVSVSFWHCEIQSVSTSIAAIVIFTSEVVLLVWRGTSCDASWKTVVLVLFDRMSSACVCAKWVCASVCTCDICVPCIV